MITKAAKLKRVFISHPFKSDPESNKQKAEGICRELISKGEILPISPLHLFSFVEDENGIREDIIQACFQIIETCDELWVYGNSKGCKREVELAKQVGVKVRRKS